MKIRLMKALLGALAVMPGSLYLGLGGAAAATQVDPLIQYAKYTSEPKIAQAMAAAAAATSPAQTAQYPGYISEPPMVQYWCGLFLEEDCVRYFGPKPPAGQSWCIGMRQADCVALVQKVQVEERRWYQNLYNAIAANNNDARAGKLAQSSTLATQPMAQPTQPMAQPTVASTTTSGGERVPAPWCAVNPSCVDAFYHGDIPPDFKPPATQPTQPVTQPTQPVTQPVTQPTQPVTQPTQPLTPFAQAAATLPWTKDAAPGTGWCGLLVGSDCEYYFGPKPGANSPTWCGLATATKCAETYFTALNNEVAALRAYMEAQPSAADAAAPVTTAAAAPVSTANKPDWYLKYTSDPKIIYILKMATANTKRPAVPGYVDFPPVYRDHCGYSPTQECLIMYYKVQELTPAQLTAMQNAVSAHNQEINAELGIVSYKTLMEHITDPGLIDWVWVLQYKGNDLHLSVDMNSPAAQAGMQAAHKTIAKREEILSRCGLLSDIDCRMMNGKMSMAEYQALIKECCSGGKAAGIGLGPNGGGNPNGTNYCCMDGWGADMLHKEFVHKWELLAYVHTTQPYSGGQLIGIGTNTSNVYMEIVPNPYYIGKPWETPIIQAK